jgi:hypothetical protein
MRTGSVKHAGLWMGMLKGREIDFLCLDKNEINPKYIGLDGMDLIHLAQDRDDWNHQ